MRTIVNISYNGPGEVILFDDGSLEYLGTPSGASVGMVEDIQNNVRVGFMWPANPVTSINGIPIPNNNTVNVPYIAPTGSNYIFSGTSTVTIDADYYLTGIEKFAKNLGIDPTYTPHNGECSSCKKEGKLVLKYSFLDINRYICDICIVKKLDSSFGTKNNADTEKVLYGK